MISRILLKEDIAFQLAQLINRYNNLESTYTKELILNNKANYIVESIGTRVIGCAAIEKQAYAISELKHIVVSPEARRTGIASYLVSSAISKSQTPLIYATVREDNPASQKLLEKRGFSSVGFYTTEKRDVKLYVITSKKWINFDLDKAHKNGILQC